MAKIKATFNKFKKKVRESSPEELKIMFKELDTERRQLVTKFPALGTGYPFEPGKTTGNIQRTKKMIAIIKNRQNEIKKMDLPKQEQA